MEPVMEASVNRQLSEADQLADLGVDPELVQDAREHLDTLGIDLNDPRSVAGRQALIVSDAIEVVGIGSDQAEAVLAHIRQPEVDVNDVLMSYSLNSAFVLSALRDAGGRLADKEATAVFAQSVGYIHTHHLRKALLRPKRHGLVETGNTGYPLDLTEAGHTYADYYGWLIPDGYDHVQPTFEGKTKFAPRLYRLVSLIDSLSDPETETEATGARSWYTDDGVAPVYFSLAETLEVQITHAQRLLNRAVSDGLVEHRRTNNLGKAIIAAAITNKGREWLDFCQDKYPDLIAKLYGVDASGNFNLEALDGQQLRLSLQSINHELQLMRTQLRMPEHNYYNGADGLDESELREEIRSCWELMQSFEQDIDSRNSRLSDPAIEPFKVLLRYTKQPSSTDNEVVRAD
ncbi:MAG TPA: hypothetical protein VNG32_02575 [Candidatus Dormibacteraeota bacterium]|nr:hypothetical protein [Candidatus Dormibacteraeota bacterium]